MHRRKKICWVEDFEEIYPFMRRLFQRDRKIATFICSRTSLISFLCGNASQKAKIE